MLNSQPLKVVECTVTVIRNLILAGGILSLPILITGCDAITDSELQARISRRAPSIELVDQIRKRVKFAHCIFAEYTVRNGATVVGMDTESVASTEVRKNVGLQWIETSSLESFLSSEVFSTEDDMDNYVSATLLFSKDCLLDGDEIYRLTKLNNIKLFVSSNGREIIVLSGKEWSQLYYIAGGP